MELDIRTKPRSASTIHLCLLRYRTGLNSSLKGDTGGIAVTAQAMKEGIEDLGLTLKQMDNALDLDNDGLRVYCQSLEIIEENN